MSWGVWLVDLTQETASSPVAIYRMSISALLLSELRHFNAFSHHDGFTMRA